MRKAALSTIVGLAFVAASVGAPAPASAVPAVASPDQPTVFQAAASKYKFKNCKALNKVYKHGVGRSNARDKTSGKRVTNFKKSTSLYKKIIRYRPSLDRDKDGIACEKR